MTGLRRLLPILALLFVFAASQAAVAGPSMVAGDGPTDLATQTKVKITGSGFQPGQELSLVVNYPDGTMDDIGWALDPAPKADASGNWTTTFDGKRHISKKLIKAGAYKLEARDLKYNKICATTMEFTGKPAKKKK